MEIGNRASTRQRHQPGQPKNMVLNRRWQNEEMRTDSSGTYYPGRRVRQRDPWGLPEPVRNPPLASGGGEE